MISKTPLAEPEDTTAFFLPNVCQPQPVFMLVLMAELAALLVALVQWPAVTSAQFWYSLAMNSLYIQWISLSCAAILCGLRRWLTQWSRPAAATMSYGVILGITLLVAWASQWIAIQLGSQSRVEMGEVGRQILISAILGGLVLRYFYVHQQWQQQQAAVLVHRIQALQSRIRPHFLFNSMNSIASLIAVNPVLAETLVEDLAELFRAALHRVGDQVSLSDELDICRRYIHIEQLRLSERLQVDWQIDETVPLQARIPLLTVQPLLENAIYHGIAHLPEGGVIQLKITTNKEYLDIQVHNPCPRHRVKKTSGHQMALDNIQQRLQALYGRQAHCDWQEMEGYFTVHLRYPFSLVVL